MLRVLVDAGFTAGILRSTAAAGRGGVVGAWLEGACLDGALMDGAL